MSWDRFLSDHGGEVITTVAGATIGFIVSWYFFRAARQSKHLTWHLDIDEWLLTKNAPAGLKVMHDGVELEQPRLISLFVINSGNRGIHVDDFIKKISIGVTGGLIRSVTYTPTHMKDTADPGHSYDGPMVVHINPIRMNPGDGFNVRLIVDGGAARDVSLTTTLFEETAQPRREQDLPAPVSINDMALRMVLAAWFIFMIIIGNLFLVLIGIYPNAGILDGLSILAILGLLGIWATRVYFRKKKRDVRARKFSTRRADSSHKETSWAIRSAVQRNFRRQQRDEVSKSDTINTERRPGARGEGEQPP